MFRESIGMHHYLRCLQFYLLNTKMSDTWEKTKTKGWYYKLKRSIVYRKNTTRFFLRTKETVQKKNNCEEPNTEEEEEEIKDEFTKMAEKLAPEKRHIFLHNGTFLFHLSIFIPFHFYSIKQTNSFFFNLGQKVFEWDQTLDEVNIYINLPPNVHSKLFYCTIQSKHIELGIKGNPPFLNVTLFSFLLSFFVVA